MIIGRNTSLRNPLIARKNMTTKNDISPNTIYVRYDCNASKLAKNHKILRWLVKNEEDIKARLI